MVFLAAVVGGATFAFSWPLGRPFVGGAFENLALALLTLLGVTVAILLLALDIGRAGSRVAPSQTLDPIVGLYLGGYLVCVVWLLQFGYFLQAEPLALSYCLLWPVTVCLDSIISARIGLGITFTLVFSLLPFLHRTFARVSPPGLYVVLQARIFSPRASTQNRERSLLLYSRYLGVFLAERDLAAVRAGVDALVRSALVQSKAPQNAILQDVVAMLASARGAAVDSDSLAVLEGAITRICGSAGGRDVTIRNALMAKVVDSLTSDARTGRASASRSVQDLVFAAEIARLTAKASAPVLFGAFVQSCTERLESGLLLEDRDTARRVLHELIRIGHAHLKLESDGAIATTSLLASNRGEIAAAISRAITRIDEFQTLNIATVSEVLDLVVALVHKDGLKQAQRLTMVLLEGGGDERALYVVSAVSPTRLSGGERSSEEAALRLLELKRLCGQECLRKGLNKIAAILMLSAADSYQKSGQWEWCLTSLRALLLAVSLIDPAEAVIVRRDTRTLIVRVGSDLGANSSRALNSASNRVAAAASRRR